MLSQPRTARKAASNSWRRSESGTARMRMTMGLTLRRTARRINRLNGARMLILSGYAAQQTPDFLALSFDTGSSGCVENLTAVRSLKILVEPVRAVGSDVSER